MVETVDSPHTLLESLDWELSSPSTGDSPGSRTVNPEPSQLALTLLQQQLAEKDQLVIALTERLEQAAEQLDRLRRSGSTMRRTGGSGGLPTELLDDHRSAIDDLKQVVGRWEEMQCGATLGRLEMQVSELRDLVAGIATQGGPHRSESGHSVSSTHATHATHVVDGVKKGNWWDQQKAAMLAGETLPLPGQDAPEADEDSVDQSTGEGIPDLPAAVDFETLTLESAIPALRERDELLVRLRELALCHQARDQFPGEIHGLDSLPLPLRERLQTLEAEWQAKFRQAEMDLSIERARLSRTEATLRQKLDQMSKDQRQPTEGVGKPDAAATTSKRWLRFLGSSQS